VNNNWSWHLQSPDYPNTFIYSILVLGYSLGSQLLVRDKSLRYRLLFVFLVWVISGTYIALTAPENQ
jgi:hypothetical protein